MSSWRTCEFVLCIDLRDIYEFVTYMGLWHVWVCEFVTDMSSWHRIEFATYMRSGRRGWLSQRQMRSWRTCEFVRFIRLLDMYQFATYMSLRHMYEFVGSWQIWVRDIYEFVTCMCKGQDGILPRHMSLWHMYEFMTSMGSVYIWIRVLYFSSWHIYVNLGVGPHEVMYEFTKFMGSWYIWIRGFYMSSWRV